MTAGLCARAIVAGYSAVPVLHGLSVEVAPGCVTCVLGANGAGKTTLARCLAGLLPVRSGDVTLDGRSIRADAPKHRVKAGLALAPEGRALFPSLSVADHLALGALRRGRRERVATQRAVLDLFPELGSRSRQRAGTLSGGEQQMLAIGRALMSRPRFLLLDEPSFGLAPRLTSRILDAARALADDGLGVLLIEQNAVQALERGDRAVVIERGCVAASGEAAEIAQQASIAGAYLGGMV
jgi:branched-chain amino acid transport system ATP-binding protein